MRRTCIFLMIVIIVCVSLRLTGSFVLAQSADPTAARQAELQAQLDQVLKEIDQQQQILNGEKQKGVSLQGDINILNAKIKTAQLNIQVHELAILGLGKDINQKTQVITQLSGKIDDTHASLGQLVRKTNEMDAFSLPDVILSDKNISSFFADVDAYGSIKQSIQVALGYIKQSKQDTETAKQNLDKKRLQEIDAKISIQDEQAKIKASEAEKARLLSLSKEQQKNYQGQIAKRQAQAAAIRAALFSLRDTGAIPFGQALQYATQASGKTGVRPAFLLAILTQESNLGKNVGSCYLSDTNTGAGVKVTSGLAVMNVMKPSRDVAPFLAITAAVGRNPMQTRISCPIGGSGYGGAMGPSQFIPSTWTLFEQRIAAALGRSNPDPWNPQDAFMASALYLGDLGAGTASFNDERNAACRYYSGRSCDSRSPANTFYGNSVMAKASTIQSTMIDPLSGT
jgi:membrane-bound lytic murein transglycosylase B